MNINLSDIPETKAKRIIYDNVHDDMFCLVLKFDEYNLRYNDIENELVSTGAFVLTSMEEISGTRQVQCRIWNPQFQSWTKDNDANGQSIDIPQLFETIVIAYRKAGWTA